MRKDPTEFRERFKKWQSGEKVYEAGLPKFEGGEEKFKFKKTPEFVQAGRDNSWSKVTNDDIGEVFQNVVARPNRTGGNTSAGNWKKQWEPKYEKPLEIVSPEFDVISGIRGVAGMLPKKATTITAKNAAKITPKQWDDAYMSAIHKGDMNEIQRLRDLHFIAKAPETKITTLDGKPQHIYHGTDSKWVSYDPTKFGSATDDGYYGVGLYGTEYRPLAKGYGNNIMDLYINAKRPYTAGTQNIYGFPYTMDESVDRASVIRYFNRDRSGVRFGNVGDYEKTNFPKLLAELDNADAAVYGTPTRRFDEIVIPSGKQMKFADPITYDDAGKIIPLSQRDNFNIADLRYGVVPTLIGGSAYQMYK